MEKYKLSLKEHQMKMLHLMKEFDDFCNKKGLSYYLTGGTLLGAVRHQGFIPWDDDVDIVMPRNDYEILLQYPNIAPDAQIVSMKNEQGYYHPFPYCNITDTETLMVEKLIKHPTGKGIFLDIFPLDGLPDDESVRMRHVKKINFYETVFDNAINCPPGIKGLKNSAKTILHYIAAPLDEYRLGNRIDLLAKCYNYETSNFVAHLVIMPQSPLRFITPIEDYSSNIYLNFEGYKFRCPVGYKNILARSYGDYMKLPPVSEQEGHHGIDIYLR